MTLFEWDLQTSRFRHQYLDERDDHISVQEVEVNVPTRKRRINDGLSEEDSNTVSLSDFSSLLSYEGNSIWVLFGQTIAYSALASGNVNFNFLNWNVKGGWG